MYKVLIKDNFSIYTKGIAAIIKSRFSKTHITETSSVHELLQKISEQNRDMIIFDMEETDKDDFNLLQQIKMFNPQAATIVTTHSSNPLYISDIKSAGISACILKNCSEEDFIRIIENTISLKTRN